MLKPVYLLMMFALAAPAAAQNAAPPQQAAPAASNDKGNPDRLICERQEELGTRLGAKKVCKTKAQWDDERQQNRDTLDKFQQQNTSTPSSGGI